MSVKVYELFPVAGGFSNKTAEYEGTTFAVAAGSSQQAHALAHKDVWATNPDNPLGILWVYRRGESPDHRLFNSDRVYGSQVRHGASKRAISAWMHGVLENSGS